MQQDLKKVAEQERLARNDIVQRLRRLAQHATLLANGLNERAVTVDVAPAEATTQLSFALDEISAFINAVPYGALVEAVGRHTLIRARAGD